MRTTNLHPGTRIKVNKLGWEFTAKVTGKRDGLVFFMPDRPERFTWRHAKPIEIRERLA